MRATKTGPVVGMALENFNKAKGQVLVKVASTWWAPEGSPASLAGTSRMFSELEANSGTFAKLDAGEGLIDSLVVTTGAFRDLEATDGKFGLLSATKATFENLQATVGKFENLEAGKGVFTNLVVTNGAFETLKAGTGTFGTVEAKEGLTVGEGGATATITRHLSAVAALDFKLPASSCQDLTLRVAGAGITGDTVGVGAPSTLGADLSVTGFVTAPDTVTVRLCNPTTRPVDPEIGSYRVDVWQHE
jgi:hypothetical protein